MTATRVVHRTLRGLLLALVATALVATLVSEAVRAQGPGTEYFQCRDQAWADYNDCLMSGDGWWHDTKCFFAWDIDNIGCDVDLIRNIIL